MNLRTAARAVAGMLLVAACGGTAATSLPTLAPSGTVPSATASAATSAAPTTAPTPAVTAAPTPTPTATPAPTPAPTATPAPTPAPTAAPTPTPTPTPTATPTPTLSPAPSASDEATFPNEAETLLITYVKADLRDTCARYRRVYATEIDSVTCGTEELPFEYTLFATTVEMRAAYERDLSRSQTKPVPNGKCALANYENTYPINGKPGGRIQCREHTSSSTGLRYRDIEWTNDELLVIGFVSNRIKTWDELIAFWSTDAGPFKP